MSATASLAQLTSIDTAKLLTMTGEVFDAERARSPGLLTGVDDEPHGGRDGNPAGVPRPRLNRPG